MSWFREMAGLQASRQVSECRQRKGLRTKPWCNLTPRSWEVKRSQVKRLKISEPTNELAVAMCG